MTRSRGAPPDPGRATAGSEINASPASRLTLNDRSVALPDNVRELLDWLIDEELKRWQREEQ